MTSTTKGSVEVDWSGLTAVTVCPLCGIQEGPHLSRNAASTLARKHWSTFHNDKNAPKTPRLKQPCIEEDCDNLSKTKGMCSKHYQRTIAAAKRARLGPIAKRRCLAGGCVSDHYAKDLCLKHYRIERYRQAKATE